MMYDEYGAGRRDALEDAAEDLSAFLAWLDAEIEAARQVADDATRSALERVKARLVG